MEQFTTDLIAISGLGLATVGGGIGIVRLILQQGDRLNDFAKHMHEQYRQLTDRAHEQHRQLTDRVNEQHRQLIEQMKEQHEQSAEQHRQLTDRVNEQHEQLAEQHRQLTEQMKEQHEQLAEQKEQLGKWASMGNSYFGTPPTEPREKPDSTR